MAVRSSIRNAKLLLLIISLILSGLTHAAKLYKYKDENGRWVFSDQKPQENVDYEQERLVVTEAQSKVSISNHGTKLRPILVAVNQLHGPVEIVLHIDQHTNMKISDTKRRWIVPGPGEKTLLYLERDDPYRSFGYRWRVDVTLGEPLEMKPIKPLKIGLPFAGGEFVISQAFFGVYSHKGHPESEYAVDIAMPRNTPIVAVRDGIVMDTENDFSRSGWDMQYADEANIVRVLHGDKTMALYAHLEPDTIAVRPGERVSQGQTLGFSGNTGFSSGPHLHFAVQANYGLKLQSLPIRFEGYPKEPKAGQLLVSNRPVGVNSSANKPTSTKQTSNKINTIVEKLLELLN